MRVHCCDYSRYRKAMQPQHTAGHSVELQSTDRHVCPSPSSPALSQPCSLFTNVSGQVSPLSAGALVLWRAAASGARLGAGRRGRLLALIACTTTRCAGWRIETQQRVEHICGWASLTLMAARQSNSANQCELIGNTYDADQKAAPTCPIQYFPSAVVCRLLANLGLPGFCV
eukprot:6204412-Pleurochrysis_carterae.AAC.1